MRRSISLFPALFCLLTTSLFAQKPEKWGQIPPEDLKLAACPFDSGASAMILQDIGKIFFKLGNRGFDKPVFEVHFTQHRRIKVFDQNAFKEGNILIPFYAEDNWEKLRDLQVQVISPDGQKTPVSTDNIFTENLTKRWKAKKIFVPKLQKGSIIEYRYEILSSDFGSLRPWEFQDDLPVRWSEIEVSVPNVYEYVYLGKTTQSWAVNETTTGSFYFPHGGSVSESTRRLGAKNLPAMKAGEPFITTLDDYRTRIAFQLQRYGFPEDIPKEYFSTWEKLTSELEEYEHFGFQYLKKGRSNKLWEAFQPLLKPGDAPEIIAQKAQHFVATNLKWDGEYFRYTEGDVDEAFAKKSGNSAEVNLALVALLRQAGLDAKPLLVSTRSNGRPFPEYPFVDQFNSVLALVFLDKDKPKVLDATSPNYGFNLGDADHFNGAGFILDKKAGGWADLNPVELNETYFAQLQLDTEGKLSGKMSLSLNGQNTAAARSDWAKDATGKFLKSRFTKRFPEAATDSIKFTNADDPNQPFRADFRVDFPNGAQANGDFLYCSPIADFAFLENPFKSLARNYPVDFPYPIKGQYTLRLTAPPGYTVEELPQALNLALPNNGGRVLFTCSQAENVVSLNLKMTLSQLTFLPEEYDGLRVFFDKMVEKTTEQIVFKKS